MNRFASFLCLVVLTLAGTSANAAVKLYATFSDTNSHTECMQEYNIINPLIVRFHGPADWTWIVVCDESAWKRVEDHMGQIDVQGRILASTDLTYRMTYVRGYDVIHPVNRSATYRPEHTIAHEMGHVLANTHNEDKAERKGQELLSEDQLAKGGN